jgi:hypothetical protein
MVFDYATALVIGQFEDVCRAVTSLDQEAVAVAVDEGLVALIPGRGDYFGDEVAEEVSRILGTGAIGWVVEDGELVSGTIYDCGDELLEYVSNPVASLFENVPTGTVRDPVGVEPELFVPFGTDRMDLDALRVALVGGAREPGSPWSEPRRQHALIMAALGLDPAPFTCTLDQALAADLHGARYLAASDCAPSD